MQGAPWTIPGEPDMGPLSSQPFLHAIGLQHMGLPVGAQESKKQGSFPSIKCRSNRLIMWKCGRNSQTICGPPPEAPENWCLWTVVLEKTLESPLDCKEIQPVHPKGDQPWIFIGRTDAEAEILILWPPDAKNWLTGKDPNAGKDWRQEEKGTTEDEMVGRHHQLNGHECEQTPGVSEGQGSLVRCSPWGHRVSHDWATEQQQQPGTCIQDEPVFFHELSYFDWPLLSRIYNQKEARYHLLNVLKIHNVLFKKVMCRLSLCKISSLNYQPHTWAVAICKEGP